MKILFLTPQLPHPPQKGTALRNWGLVSGLAERHQVAVLSVLDPGQEAELSEEMQAVGRVEAIAAPGRTTGDRLRDLLLTRRPDMGLRLKSEAYARRLAEWLAGDSFDVVHVEGIELAPYLDVIEAATPRPLIVFDDHNCEYLLQRRAFLTDLQIPARWTAAAYSFIQWRRLRRYEALACRRADRVLAVSEADGEALAKLVPGLDVAVISNGIDTRAYVPAPESGGVPTLVFTGTMDYRPNVDAVLWFAREVLPRVRTEVADVRLMVVGQRPHRRLEVLRENPAVTLTGWVADTRPHIAEGTVYVAPLRIGGGTRLKLLEAMACGRPVVSTRLGAEGFPVTHGRELLLADTPEEFAARVVALLRSPERRAHLGRAGRVFVEERYDWRAIVPRVEALYECGR